MKRKIIKQGHNTLTVTIPAIWARRFNIQAGKEVDLIERDNGLFISSERSDDNRQVELNIAGMDIPTIWKHFMGVYREGFNEVKVKFTPGVKIESPYKFFTKHKLDLRYKKEPEKKLPAEALQGFVNRFIGFEIVEHGKDYVLVKEMGEPTSKEFDNSLRRIFLLLQQMADECVEAMMANDSKIVEHMHDIDINIDKFQDYCIRILNKVGHKEPRKTSILFATLNLLELIGDEYKNIAGHIINDFSKAKFTNILDIAEGLRDEIYAFYELFYKYDLQKIKKIADIDQKIHFGVVEKYKKSTEDEKEVYHHLRVITRYINSLVELRVEMEF
jgi:phosphate uptake regulator